MKIQGLNEFLEELESHCHSKAIATFVGSDGDRFVVDLERKGNRVRYGYEPEVKELFVTKLASRCDASWLSGSAVVHLRNRPPNKIASQRTAGLRSPARRQSLRISKTISRDDVCLSKYRRQNRRTTAPRTICKILLTQPKTGSPINPSTTPALASSASLAVHLITASPAPPT